MALRQPGVASLTPGISYGVSDVLEGESNELASGASGSESNRAPENSVYLSLTHFF